MPSINGVQYFGSHWFGMDRVSDLPDEAEALDWEALKGFIERYFDETYPAFEPEIVHTPDKDYYLPALKVLIRNKKGFFSPSRVAEWKGGELVAGCRDSGAFTYQRMVMYLSSREKNQQVEPIAKKPYIFLDHKDCECGIYGSVNLEEVRGYNRDDNPNFDDDKPKGKLTLCIIEPSIGADVFLCRKGWRASSAFISEIVGETMSVQDASQLLSIAWHRELDVRSVLHESR